MPGTDNATAWAVAGNATSDLANTLAVQASNKQYRKYNDKVYEKTKADNLAFWNMQNEYNAPAAQMQRFKDAGLNPNLIYGSSGDNSAGNIDTPNVQPAHIDTPQIHAGSNVLAAALAHADLKIKDAQANNLNIQSETLRQDAMLRALQVQKEGVDVRRAGFDLDFLGDTRQANMDFLTESVRQKRVSTDLAINADARAAILQNASLPKIAEEIKTLIEQRRGFSLDREHTAADTARIYQTITNMQKDGTLKDWEIQLSRSGMTPKDPLWLRTILNILSGESGILSPLKEIPSGTNFFPDGGNRQ